MLFITYTAMSHHILSTIGRIATRYPVTWIYSFMAAGMAFAIALYGWLGWTIGSAIGAPMTTQYLALSAYGFWFVGAIPTIHALCDQQIGLLRQMAAILESEE